MVGNYHNTKGEKLLNAGLKYFSSFQNTICLIVNRTPVEQKFIKEKFFDNKKIRFLDKAVDGLQLLFSADIAISGGGTMNRESSLLGTETYSIFSGKRPYLDEYLRDLGKLKFIDDEKDFEKIFVEKKNKTFIKSNYKNLVVEIIDLILSFI
jgi:predicted glycosyltransferase